MNAQIARQLAAARSSADTVRAIASPASVPDAYVIQGLVLQLLHDEVGGWKAAGDSPQGFARLAPLHASVIGFAGARATSLLGWGVELELAFRFGREVRDGEALAGEALLAALSEVRVCLELCRSRIESGASPLLFLADDLANDGVVLGTGVTVHANLDLAGRDARLSVNGRVTCASITGSQQSVLSVLEWLTRQPRIHGGLKQGHWAITGSLTGLTPVVAGDRVDASIDGIGALSFTVPSPLSRD